MTGRRGTPMAPLRFYAILITVVFLAFLFAGTVLQLAGAS